MTDLKRCGCSKCAAYFAAVDELGVGPTVTLSPISAVFDVPLRPWGMPTDAAERKQLPVWDGSIMYFPLATLAECEVSRVGNDQHNPGEKLHWARGKSTDQANTAMRHMMDDDMGVEKDTDGCWHLAKAIWRLRAKLQLRMEAARDRGEKLFTGKYTKETK